MVAVGFSRVLLKLSPGPRPPPSPPPPPSSPFRLSSPILRPLVPVCSLPSPSLLSLSTVRRRFRRLSAQEDGAGAGASETLEEAKDAVKEDSGEEKEAKEEAVAAAASSVAEELKQMMEARRKESSFSSSSDLFTGVLEEVRQIEWPAFRKVLSTTGIVLVVIVGSSVALLTINAILSELSDKAFAGRGIQDFF